jgi:hypothetical protein
MRRSRVRSSKGQAIVAMIVVIGLSIMSMLVIFGFELSRVYLSKQQLQNASDAAALTAVAELASQDISDPVGAHNAAIQAALELFRNNTVLGQSLQPAVVSASKSSMECTLGQSKIFFEFIDPQTGKVVPLSSPDGKVVRVTANAGLPLAFGKFMGMPSFNMSTVSDGAVPMLDLVICYDVSGSMDDQTPVTVVKRAWDTALNKTTYQVTNGAHGPLQGKIFDIAKPNPTGLSFNGVEPQGLTDAYDSSHAYFSEWLAQYYGVPGLRSGGVASEQGQSPGNCPPKTAPSDFGVPMYTDCVVNIDGNTSFGGMTYKGYNFPNVATLVEASRGNLEDPINFNQSKADLSVPSGIAPRAGYKAAYTSAAKEVLQPLVDSQDATGLFCKILNTDTDCHFGMIAFDSNIGNDSGSTENWNSLDWQVPYGAKKDFALPMVPLDKAKGVTHYSDVLAAVNKCLPMGGTNIGASIHKAVETLKTNSRKGSVRAIVLFTDGQPSDGSPLDDDPWQNARKAAMEARQEGIAIYTIGLAQNPAIKTGEIAILNDTNKDPSTGGVAAIAGNGGTFNLVTDSKNLRVAFEKIARRLVEIVRFGGGLSS